MGNEQPLFDGPMENGGQQDRVLGASEAPPQTSLSSPLPPDDSVESPRLSGAALHLPQAPALPQAPDSYTGILLIGDPHLEGRTPGFRKDDYAEVVLEKLQWCLDYAAEQRLLPALLGDLFDKPRDNPNWLLVRLLNMLRGEVIGLYGNHDCAEPQLSDNDSLSVLVQSGRLRLVSAEQPWRGMMAGRSVVIGGSSYRQPIPKQFERELGAGSVVSRSPDRDTPLTEGLPASENSETCGRESGTVGRPSHNPSELSHDVPLVIWLTHHDVLLPGYDEGHIRPREVPGIDLLVNGHIHRRLENVAAGGTLWVTPGNISRRKRSDATRLHVPSVLRVDILPDGYELHDVQVPHRPFEEVFHEMIADAPVERQESAFVSGLAELQARRTASGAGLMEFLEQNISQLDAAVAAEIRTLAMEVTTHGAN